MNPSVINQIRHNKVRQPRQSQYLDSAIVRYGQASGGSATYPIVFSQWANVYEHLTIKLNQIHNTNNGSVLSCRISFDGGSTYQVANYFDTRAATSTEIILTGVAVGVVSAADWGRGVSGSIDLYNTFSWQSQARINGDVGFMGAVDGTYQRFLGGGSHATEGIVNAIQLAWSTGVFSGVDWELWGW